MLILHKLNPLTISVNYKQNIINIVKYWNIREYYIIILSTIYFVDIQVNLLRCWTQLETDALGWYWRDNGWHYKWIAVFQFFAPLGHGWDTGAEGEREGHKKCTRGARDVHLWALKGTRYFSFWQIWDTFETRALKEHKSCTRDAQEGHKRCTRGTPLIFPTTLTSIHAQTHTNIYTHTSHTKTYLISQCVTLLVSPGSTATMCSMTIGSGCWKRWFSLKGMSLNLRVGVSNILCRYASHLIVSRCIGSWSLLVCKHISTLVHISTHKFISTFHNLLAINKILKEHFYSRKYTL